MTVAVMLTPGRGAISLYAPERTPATPLAWQDEALCAQADIDAYFPDKGESPRAAKAICARCDVAAQCLAYALENNERFGVWGGLTDRQRRKLIKERAA